MLMLLPEDVVLFKDVTLERLSNRLLIYIVVSIAAAKKILVNCELFFMLTHMV